jgi:hypothetical protein
MPWYHRQHQFFLPPIVDGHITATDTDLFDLQQHFIFRHGWFWDLTQLPAFTKLFFHDSNHFSLP